MNTQPKDQHQIVKSHHKYEPASRQYVATTYETQEFPKWKYHAHDGRAREVKNAEEEKRLGSEWQDARPQATTAPAQPADFDALHQKNKELETQLAELKARQQDTAKTQC